MIKTRSGNDEVVAQAVATALDSQWSELEDGSRLQTSECRRKMELAREKTGHVADFPPAKLPVEAAPVGFTRGPA